MPDNAASENRDTTEPATAAPPLSQPEAASGAIRTLRFLLVGTIVVPIVLAVVGGYFSYRATYQHAATALAEADAVAEENTTKILDTHVLVAKRIDDLLRGRTDQELQADEATLHRRMAQQIANLPQVAAAWIIDADGHELASARVFPVNRQLDLSHREDFKALRDGPLTTFIQAVRARSVVGGGYHSYFTVSLRRSAPDGKFRGIIVIAVSGPYFASFYNSLLGSSAQYTATVLREDGTTLARYPATAAPPPPQWGDQPLAKAIAGRTTAGVLSGGSGLWEGRLVAYRRLADYPVYVTIGRTRASITREWLRAMAGYAAVGVPAAIGLMLISLLALRRTRREQLALAAARDATARRAAIEEQLHRAQRSEAVGLLTSGIAHDFNNLLTIVAGNIALLEGQESAAGGRRQRLIAAARTGCDRASALTKRLLTYAQREPADPQRVDINQVIAGMSDLPWRSLGDRITVEFRLAEHLWPVFIDPGQLEDALLNLALNARDAMAGAGRLTIETLNLHHDDGRAHPPREIAGDFVALHVGDTGCGMPPEVRDKAFDPFFTTKGDGKGSGLGLSQVNGFVTRFGGYCIIDSAPGQGTTIRLRLPRYTGGASDQVAADPVDRQAARTAAK